MMRSFNVGNATISETVWKSFEVAWDRSAMTKMGVSVPRVEMPGMRHGDFLRDLFRSNEPLCCYRSVSVLTPLAKLVFDYRLMTSGRSYFKSYIAITSLTHVVQVTRGKTEDNNNNILPSIISHSNYALVKFLVNQSMRRRRPHFERALERRWMTENKRHKFQALVRCVCTNLIVERRNVILGITGVPFSSTGASMENTDKIVAMAIQTVSSAMFFPAHELDEVRGRCLHSSCHSPSSVPKNGIVDRVWYVLSLKALRIELLWVWIYFWIVQKRPECRP